MRLEIQFLTIMYNLVFGMVISFVYTKYLSIYRRFSYCYKLINTFLLNIILVLLYFFLLIRVNTGLVNIYSFIFILIGMFLSNKCKYLLRRMVKRKKL